MAALRIDIQSILGNIDRMDAYLQKNGVTWSLVTKVLNGHKPTLERLLASDTVLKLHSIGDSRISNLRIVKSIKPSIVTMYMKPAAYNLAKSVVSFADISMNTSLKTIQALNTEAERQGKSHRIIIMIELGELREGILRDNVLRFYDSVFHLSHIQVAGIGSNLGCMYGIEPTYDKLIQLCLYKMLIEERFGQKLELVSGGSSNTLSLIANQRLPPGVNHLRIGETAFFGRNLLTGKRFRNLSTNVFDFTAEIVEIEKKESIPDGNLSDSNIGHVADTEPRSLDWSYRGIVDFGILDVNVDDLQPTKEGVRFAGTTSDMSVYDLGKDRNSLSVGKTLHFHPNYMAVARLMHSRYIAKDFI